MPAAPPPYPAGHVLPGSPYLLQRILGTGGTAVAYEAEDTSCGRLAVIKVIRPEVAARGDFSAARLEREARTLVQLQQETEHVVEVITAGVTGDAQRLPYYVMERLEGPTLRHAIDVHRGVGTSMAVDEVAGIGIDLARALECAHARYIVHQDVKPENIFLHRKRDGARVVKLLDFGIATLVGELAGAGGFRGTYRYAAPEQLRGERVTWATDLYGLGLVLFEALTLRSPFEDPAHPASTAALEYAHCNVEAPRASEYRTEVPPALDELVAACLQKDPGARPPGAHAVVNALRKIRREFESRLVGATSGSVAGSAITDIEPPPDATDVDLPLEHVLGPPKRAACESVEFVANQKSTGDRDQTDVSDREPSKR